MLRKFYASLWSVLFIVIVGTLLSSAIAWKSAQWISETERERMHDASEQTTLLICNALQKHVQLLQSLSAFFNLVDTVNAKQWNYFLQAHAIQEAFVGVEVFAYAPKISVSEVANHEKQMLLEGYSTYRIYPQRDRDVYFPITLVEPASMLNIRALGYDITAEKKRFSAVSQAIQTGEATFSSKIELVMHNAADERREGFLLYLPIYEPSMPHSNAHEREAAVKGVVMAALQMKKFFSTILGTNYMGIDFEVYEANLEDESVKIYDSKPSLTRPRLVENKVVTLYGKQWKLLFKADHVADIGLNHYLPYVEWFAGVLLSLLAGALLRAHLQMREEALLIAEEMTQHVVQSELEIRTFFQAMNEGILIVNAAGEITRCNHASEEILQLGKHDIIGDHIDHLGWNAIHENGVPFKQEERPIVKVLQMKEPQRNVIMGIQRQDHSILWVQVNAQPIFSKEHKIVSAVITMSDITLYHLSKYKLQRYLDIIDRFVNISTTDCSGRIIEVSRAFCELSGYTKEEVLGKNHNITRHPDVDASIYKEMWEQLEQNVSWEGELKNRRKDGSDYWVKTVITPLYDDMGVKVGYTAVREDITDKKQIEKLSNTDKLTQVYNRHKLDEIFNGYLDVGHSSTAGFSIILLDIDHFKVINDTYGHQVGDYVLQEMANLIKQNLRHYDVIARWGGEEFMILLPATDIQSTRNVAEKLRLLVASTPFGAVERVTISLGVASYRLGDSQKEIISRADKALYKAKEKGRNRLELEAL